MLQAWKLTEMLIGFWVGKLKEGEHLKERRELLKYIFKKEEM
jgi:hypothetical protein